MVEPTDDAGSIDICAGICISDDTDDFYRQGEKQRASEAQLHSVETPVILTQKGDET